MNDVGLAFLWLVVQITLVVLPASALHLLSSRRGPVAGARVAAAALAMVLALTMLACCPSWPDNGLAREVIPQLPPASPEALPAVAAVPTTNAPITGFTLDRLRALWPKITLRFPSRSSSSVRWLGTAALMVLAGMCLGLLRLLFGLWAVRECRRRGTLVDDPDLLDMLETVKTALGCTRAIELRELPELDSPATAGWLRPLILLPEDWRSWPRSDLQAVLAHELAHIQRSDYVVGLAARVALALHFYHPVVRWLAGRLLAQQELAADAVGARFSGGRGAYLAVLSRMALRQDRRISTWPARAFSPARGTLIRRIRMLKVHEEVAERTWSAWGRTLAVALLSGLTLGVWLLPRPLQGADGENVAMAEAKPERPAASDVPAFDLSYIPDDAMGVFAIHPAAIFRRKGMVQYAAQLNELKAMDGLAAGLEVPLSKTPLRVEQIEQVTMGIYFGRSVSKQGASEDLRRIMAHCLMIRTTEPFDWHQLIRSLWPDATEVHEANRTYFKVNYPKLGKAPSLYVPDDRTVVCDEEPVIRRILRRTTPTKPAFARETDWSRMEHDLVALVLDNHNDRIRNATKRSHELDRDDFFAKTVASSDRWVFGLADSDDFLLHAVETCRDSASVQAIARLISNLFRETIRNSEKPHKDKIPDHLRIQELAVLVLKGFRVEAAGKSVHVEPSGGVKLAEFLPLIAKNGL